MPVLWRVFLINAVLVSGATLALAVSPATVSSELVLREIVVLTMGVSLVLLLNLALLRRTFEPLERLGALMRRVDLLAPGRRLHVSGGGPEVEELTAAFNAMLERLEAERLRTGRRAIEATEQERRRLAVELHDEVGQLLTGVLLALDDARRSAPGPLAERIERVQDAVRAGAERVREIARGLRPGSLEELGLRAAVLALLAEVDSSARLRVVRRIDTELPRLTAAQELVVYRIAQESLTNVVRHAEASSVTCTLGRRGGQLELVVRDDGAGADPEAVREGGGIAGMRERALYGGGRLDVVIHPGEGTEVRLELPIPEPGGPDPAESTASQPAQWSEPA